MTSYSTIANNEIDANSPVTASLCTRYRDNPIATAEAASGSPKMKGANMHLLNATTIPSTQSSTPITSIVNNSNFLRYRCEIIDLTLRSNADLTSLVLSFSTDNGSSWLSGSYVSTGSTNSAGIILIDVSALSTSTAQINGFIDFYAMGSSNRIAIDYKLMAMHGSSMQSFEGEGGYNTASIINAFRLSNDNSGGGNDADQTGGNLYTYGIRISDTGNN